LAAARTLASFLYRAKVARMTVDSVVPLSGGWDSVLALCEATAPTRGRRVRAMFVDYGQPYLEAERVASRWAADALKVELDVVHVPLLGIDGGGSFDGRNAMILRHAAERAEDIWFGTRCPLPMFDRHGDSNALFVRRWARQHGVRVRLPALLLPKCEVRRRVRKVLGAHADHHVYSTEGWRPQT
jgi:hypothetical protein